MTPSPLGDPYHRHPVREAYDAIVIGSGIGGLAVAALLGRHGGRRVLVLERHYTIGGFTHVFRRPGYEWDVGVHYVGETGPGSPLRALFDEVSDGTLDWADMGPVYDRIVLGDTRFDFPRGEAALRARLVERFPAEEHAIDRYFALVHATVAALHDFFAGRALPRLIDAMVNPLARRRFFRHSDRTTREVLESLTSDQRLIGVLTAQWGDYGLPPAESSFAVHALVAHHYFGGGSYPVGGAARIAGAVVPVIRAAGGEVLRSAEVAEVVVEGNRAVGVRMAADGALLRAPLVISDAGVANTFGRLVPAPVAERRGLRAGLTGLAPSIAHACLYVGLRGTARELGLERSNIWVYPDERHEHTLAASADATRTPPAYISFPSAKDPDFERRCPGRATIEVATLLPWSRFAAWEDTRWHKRGADYDAAKQAVAARLLDVLYTHVPQVRGAVEVAELSTPLSTRHFVAHPQGEIYGLAHTPARFRNPLLRPQTPLRGLFLTGADVATCGVGGALVGGALCASAILRRNVLQVAQRAHAERIAA
jgi:phytoene dehydrogenase-like protein